MCSYSYLGQDNRKRSSSNIVNVVLVLSLLTLGIFHTQFICFCQLFTSNCQFLMITRTNKVNRSQKITSFLTNPFISGQLSKTIAFMPKMIINALTLFLIKHKTCNMMKTEQMTELQLLLCNSRYWLQCYLLWKVQTPFILKSKFVNIQTFRISLKKR